jgi:hypothetical protein
VKRRDPIIDEIHAFREAFAKEHDFDMHRMVETLKQHQLASGRKTVTFAPKLIKRTRRAS